MGVGESAWSRHSGRTPLTLGLQAAQQALADAGLSPRDVDGYLSYAEGDSADGLHLASGLGVRPSYTSEIVGGGASAEFLVSTAAAAIDAGLCSTVLCYRAMNGRSGRRFGSQADGGFSFHEISPFSGFFSAHGLTTPAQHYALIARRHMHEYGTTSEQLGAVALTFREHACQNPQAMMYDRPLRMADYLASPMIADPFRLLDCCLESDGAAACIVTSFERARDCRPRPVRILSAVARAGGESVYHYGLPDITEAAGRHVAPRLFGMAGLTPSDVDVAAIYDCFTFVVLIQLEDYGFCKKGEGGAFVAGNRLSLDGTLPCNTAGGQLSEAYTHGMNNLIEVVRQLRAEYAGRTRQVVGAEVGLCTGWGGPEVASGLLLGAGP
ncbi:MAG: thiolase [Myxococcota bacterium]